MQEFVCVILPHIAAVALGALLGYGAWEVVKMIRGETAKGDGD